jgi:hypothetical protein
LLLVSGLIVGACAPGTDASTTTSDATTTVPQRECVRVTSSAAPVDTGALATDAISLSGETFTCANDVVLVAEGDSTGLIVAAQLAAALKSPLLFPHPRLASELGRLRPVNIHIVGDFEVATPPGSTAANYDTAEAVAQISSTLGTSRTVALANPITAEGLVETVQAIAEGDRVAVPAVSGDTPGSWSADPAVLIPGLAGIGATGPIWMVEADDPQTILLAASIAHAIEASVVAADLADLFRHPEVGMALNGYPDRPLRLVGSSRELDDWKLRTLVGGLELPGGGFELFPPHIKRRFVAFYGHPRSTTLGAMGQVTPEQALDLMRDGGLLTGYSPNRCLPSPCRGTVQPGLLAGFGADGAHVVPTFNYIASVAHPQCRTSLTSVETFQEGVDVASANGGYVMLDLQPGSTRFIEHAMFYEDLLRLPHVGLALDPEWRCGWPGQTEFNRIGTVTAAEVNEVINWLADLVNEEALPQKLLLIQQFRLDMIQDRDQLVDRPEIQVVIQMDGEGQGNLAIKDRTWGGVTRDTDDAHFMWGWKNFFVRDHPDGPYSPAETLDREPVPVYISYQ